MTTEDEPGRSPYGPPAASVPPGSFGTGAQQAPGGPGGALPPTPYAPDPNGPVYGGFPAQAKNTPATVSLIAGAVTVLVGAFQQATGVMLPSLMARNGWSTGQASQFFPLPFAVVNIVLALVAIGFGIAGLRQGPRGRAAAGAGIALGVSVLVSLVVAFVVIPLVARSL